MKCLGKKTLYDEVKRVNDQIRRVGLDCNQTEFMGTTLCNPVLGDNPLARPAHVS